MKLSRRELLRIGFAISSLQFFTSDRALASTKINQFKYFFPVLSMLLPKQTKLEDKFGGVPFGLPYGSKHWPVCKGCGQAMSLLAQLSHHSERLDLGRTGRVMLVFLCNTLESDLERFPDAMPGPKPPTRGGGACWHHYGADGPGSVVLLNADQLDSRLAELPVNANWPIPEARVIEWKTGTDKSPLGYATYFPPNPSYAEAPEEEIYGEIKIGGLPHWIQERGRHLYPYPAWQFVLQIPDRYRMAGKPPPADRLGGDIDFFDKKGHHLHREKTSFSKNYSFWDTSAKKDEPYWEVFFHCFGAGKGYVLLHREEGNRHLPVGKFFFDR